jgi:hypothetical protein
MSQNPATNLQPLLDLKNGSPFVQQGNDRFIRKGQVGDWKNHMSPELSERFDVWMSQHLKGIGLTFETE